METRTIQQVKVYCLIMNPVTDRAESGRISVMSFDKDRLVKFYEDEIVESYDDDRFRKVFRKGGPLEWYNPLWTLESIDSFGHGLREEWIDSTNIDYVKGNYYFV